MALSHITQGPHLSPTPSFQQRTLSQHTTIMCGPIHYQFQHCEHIFDSGQINRCQNSYQSNNICERVGGQPPGQAVVQPYPGECPQCKQHPPIKVLLSEIASATSGSTAESSGESSNSDSESHATIIATNQDQTRSQLSTSSKASSAASSGASSATSSRASSVVSSRASSKASRGQQAQPHPPAFAQAQQQTIPQTQYQQQAAPAAQPQQTFLQVPHQQNYTPNQGGRSKTSSRSSRDDASEASSGSSASRSSRVSCVLSNVLKGRSPFAASQPQLPQQPGMSDLEQPRPYVYQNTPSATPSPQGPSQTNTSYQHMPTQAQRGLYPPQPMPPQAQQGVYPQQTPFQAQQAPYRPQPVGEAQEYYRPEGVAVPAQAPSIVGTTPSVQQWRKHDAPYIHPNSFPAPASEVSHRKHRKHRSESSKKSKHSNKHSSKHKEQAAEHERKIAEARIEAMRAEEAVFEQETQRALDESRPHSLKEQLEHENQVRLATLASLEEYTSSLQQRVHHGGRQVLCIHTRCGHQVKTDAADGPWSDGSSTPNVVHLDTLCDYCYLKQETQESLRGRDKPGPKIEVTSPTASSVYQDGQGPDDESSVASSSRVSSKRPSHKSHRHRTGQPALTIVNEYYQPSVSPTTGWKSKQPAPSFISLPHSVADPNADPVPFERAASIAGTDAVSINEASQNRAREEAVRNRLFQEEVRREQWRRAHPDESSSLASSEFPGAFKGPAAADIASEKSGERRV